MDEQSKKEIDKRTEQLIKEFQEHWRDLIEENPEAKEYPKSAVFEGWAIQKIASMQLTLEKLNKQMGGPFIPSPEDN